MLAVGLALASSFAWGLADFGAGLKSRRFAVLTVLLISQVGSLPLVVAVVAVRGAGPPEDSSFAVLAFLAGASGTVGIAAFYRALAVGTMSVVAPISATAAVLPLTVGVVSGERPSAVQGLGVALALVGVVLASREAAAAAEGARSRSRTGAGVGLALVAALGFGGFFVGIDAASARGDEYWAILVQRITSLVLVAAVALRARPQLRVGLPETGALVAIGVADAVANTLFALASTRGLVSVVGILGSLYPVITILLAWTVLRERLAPAQWAGVGGALGGVALIAGG
ncbi:MAG: EamA family transporter [Thermoleophilaceae bacterium]